MKKILVVEDSLDQARLIEIILKQRKYSVRLSPNVRDALDRVIQFEPDLVLLDYSLPEESGETFCEKISVMGSPYDKIPIILMSAVHPKQLPDLAARFKTAGYLEKPFDFEDLDRKIKENLDNGPENAFEFINCPKGHGKVIQHHIKGRTECRSELFIVYGGCEKCNIPEKKTESGNNDTRGN